MLDALERYYREQGILSTDFTCPLMDDCKGDCKTFTGPKSAFVGPGYERRDLPRLLFLSLDSGWGAPDAADRLPEAVRKDEIDRDIRDQPGNHHWFLTHELAWYLLRRFDADLRLEGAKKYFAHANAAKCCQNKSGGQQADPRLFANCRKYLPGELRILHPDVLVTQGKQAELSIRSIYGDGKPLHEGTDAVLIDMDNRQVIWFHTLHPRNGRFWTHRDDGRGWEKYADLIYEFGQAAGWPNTTPPSV